MINVLVVDDNEPIQAGVQYILEEAGDIKVIGRAFNGLEALEQARQECPDVAVMDISMPLMDGIEATRQLRESCRHTRVLMLSVYDSPEYLRRALQVGAWGYVLKDTIWQELLAAVRALARGERYFSEKVASLAEAYSQSRREEGESGETEA
jgi:DNA-binding NarL/FixJ family response regulator